MKLLLIACVFALSLSACLKDKTAEQPAVDQTFEQANEEAAVPGDVPEAPADAGDTQSEE